MSQEDCDVGSCPGSPNFSFPTSFDGIIKQSPFEDGQENIQIELPKLQERQNEKESEIQALELSQCDSFSTSSKTMNKQVEKVLKTNGILRKSDSPKNSTPKNGQKKGLSFENEITILFENPSM